MEGTVAGHRGHSDGLTKFVRCRLGDCRELAASTASTIAHKVDIVRCIHAVHDRGRRYNG